MPRARLTAKEQAFVNAYIGEARGNATEAARIAGYAEPKVSGYENKQRQAIRDEIERELEARTLSRNEVLALLTQQATGTLKPFLILDAGDPVIDLSSEDARDHIHLLKKAKTKRRTGGVGENTWQETEVEVELHDPQSALVVLGKLYKLWSDRPAKAEEAREAIGVQRDLVALEQSKVELSLYRQKIITLEMMQAFASRLIEAQSAPLRVINDETLRAYAAMPNGADEFRQDMLKAIQENSQKVILEIPAYDESYPVSETTDSEQ